MGMTRGVLPLALAALGSLCGPKSLPAILSTHYVGSHPSTRWRAFAFKKALMERVMGIEPTSSAWEAEALPLDDTRVFFGSQPILQSAVAASHRNRCGFFATPCGRRADQSGHRIFSAFFSASCGLGQRRYKGYLGENHCIPAKIPATTLADCSLPGPARRMRHELEGNQGPGSIGFCSNTLQEDSCHQSVRVF